MEKTKKKAKAEKETRKEREEREKRGERAKEIAAKRPRNQIDAYITQRFVLEPRMSIAPSDRWLVVWDMLQGDYLKEKAIFSGKKRAYLRFKDSDDAVRWLRQRFKGEPETMPMATPLPKDRTEEGDIPIHDRKRMHLERIYKAISENQEALGLSDADMAEASLELGDPDRNFVRRMVAKMGKEAAGDAGSPVTEGEMDTVCEAAWHALSVTCWDHVRETMASEMAEALARKREKERKE